MSAGNDLGEIVVEVSLRQAWPVLSFCKNRTAFATETRVYVDAPFSTGDGSGWWSADGAPDPAVAKLPALNGMTVSAVDLDDDGQFGDHLRRRRRPSHGPRAP